MKSLTILSSQQHEIKPYEAPVISINAGIEQIVKALNSKLVRESMDAEILITLAEIVSKSTFEGGYTPKTADEIKAIIGALLTDVKMFWKTLTLDELKLAANRGIRGLYGEIIGVSVASLSKCFNSYMGDLQRQSAKKLLADANMIDTKPQPSEEEIKNTRIEIILNAFEKYQKTGFYDDLGNYVYDCLKTAKVISYTGKEVNEFIVTAISNLVSRKQSALMDCADLSEGRKMKRDIEYLSGEEVVVTPEIKAEAKRIMLFARFDEMIFEEVDLKSLLA